MTLLQLGPLPGATPSLTFVSRLRSVRTGMFCLEADRTSIRYRSRRSDDAAARGTAARAGLGPPAVWLSPATHPDRALRHRHEPQKFRRRRAPAGGCKRALGTLAPMAPPQGPNQRMSLDLFSA